MCTSLLKRREERRKLFDGKLFTVQRRISRWHGTNRTQHTPTTNRIKHNFITRIPVCWAYFINLYAGFNNVNVGQKVAFVVRGKASAFGMKIKRVKRTIAIVFEYFTAEKTNTLATRFRFVCLQTKTNCSFRCFLRYKNIRSLT